MVRNGRPRESRLPSPARHIFVQLDARITADHHTEDRARFAPIVQASEQSEQGRSRADRDNEPRHMRWYSGLSLDLCDRRPADPGTARALGVFVDVFQPNARRPDVAVLGRCRRRLAGPLGAKTRRQILPPSILYGRLQSSPDPRSLSRSRRNRSLSADSSGAKGGRPIRSQ